VSYKTEIIMRDAAHSKTGNVSDLRPVARGRRFSFLSSAFFFFSSCWKSTRMTRVTDLRRAEGSRGKRLNPRIREYDLRCERAKVLSSFLAGRRSVVSYRMTVCVLQLVSHALSHHGYTTHACVMIYAVMIHVTSACDVIQN